MKAAIHDTALNKLQNMIKTSTVKKAELAQTNIEGKPGTTVKAEKAPDEYEKVDQDAVGADKNPQEKKQEKSTNNAEPAKSASIKDLGAEIRQEIKKAELAQTNIEGKPGTTVKAEKAPDEYEKVDQDAVGADKNPQEKKQEKSTNNAEPAKSASDIADKIASFQTGRNLAAAILKQASFSHFSEAALLKEAAARDCDMLIAQAAAYLEPHENEKTAAYQEQELLKQAELSGAAYFDELVKASAIQETAAKNQELEQKVAALQQQVNESAQTTTAVKQAIDSKTAAEAQASAELLLFQKMGTFLETNVFPKFTDQVTKNVINTLKHEAAK